MLRCPCLNSFPAKDFYKTRSPEIIMEEVTPGKYQHYKGNFYEVIGIARDSETLEGLVIYRALYDSPEFGKNALWARPKKMFLESVEVNGRKVPRFRLVKA
jgi:hypothetical protein